MISKTSFFNKGIYKSTVKRYIWGSVLYFLILFITNSLNIILSSDRYLRQLNTPHLGNFAESPLILRGDFLGASMVFTVVVPTVVALLIFRFLHSKKASVFTHSIPVKRSANYFSSLLAAFTLMAVPVIANGIILMLMTFSFYNQFYTAADCMVWMGLLLFALFILLSCSVFSATITGNSFAVVILNILLHSVLLIIASGLMNLADVFLYGFPGDNSILDTLAENNFFGASISLGASDNFRENFTLWQGIGFIIYALILYALSLFFYIKRKLEYAEDVAGFSCLNQIFKYGVTFVFTISAFALFSHYIDENPAIFALIVFLISLISYFASQMILKKSLNIFAKSYKGYITFAVAFSLCLGVFACTDFFGYEKRVPDIDEITSVSVYNYYYNISGAEPSSQKKEIKEFAVNLHKDIVSDDIPLIPDDDAVNTRIHIKYQLKYGEELYRIYHVTEDERNAIMSYLYEDIDYKKQCEEVFLDYEDITHIGIHPRYIVKDEEVTKTEDSALEESKSEEAVPAVKLYSSNLTTHLAKELLGVIRSDVERLSYMQLRGDDDAYLLSIDFECSMSEDEYRDGRPRRNWINVRITTHHTNTLSWLKEKGIILE